MRTRTIEKMLFPIRERLRTRAALRLDADDEGKWITTENGHKVHLNEEGEPDKGNPHVVELMAGGNFEKIKQEVGKPHKFSDKELIFCPRKTKIVSGKDEYFASNDFKWEDCKTGEKYNNRELELKLKDRDVKIELPDDMDATRVKSFMKSYTHFFGKNSIKEVGLDLSRLTVEDLNELGEVIRQKNPEEAYESYVDKSAEVWMQCDKQDKEALVDYTNYGYQNINTALREGKTGNRAVDDQIDRITKAIDKMELPEDTILYRDLSASSVEKLLNIPKGSLREVGKGIIGMSGTDNGFGSTVSHNGTGMLHKNARISIIAPKGTKALYVEPFSVTGKGDGPKWDGKTRQKDVSMENEMLLQRGTSYQVYDYRYDSFHGKHIVSVIIMDQDHSNSAYDRKRA
jgi:hypothetical protein